MRECDCLTFLKVFCYNLPALSPTVLSAFLPCLVSRNLGSLVMCLDAKIYSSQTRAKEQMFREGLIPICPIPKLRPSACARNRSAAQSIAEPSQLLKRQPQKLVRPLSFQPSMRNLLPPPSAPLLANWTKLRKKVLFTRITQPAANHA